MLVVRTFPCYQKCHSLPQSRPCKKKHRSLGCLQGGRNILKIKLAFQILLLPMIDILILHLISTSTNFLLLYLQNLGVTVKAHPSFCWKIMFQKTANFIADVKFRDKHWDFLCSQVRMDLSCDATNKQSSTQTKSTEGQDKMCNREQVRSTPEMCLQVSNVSLSLTFLYLLERKYINKEHRGDILYVNSESKLMLPTHRGKCVCISVKINQI